jgi:nicotinamidase/pyrazinamidase
MKSREFYSLESLDSESSLLVVDVQNDFANKAGALYVPGGELAIPLINEFRSAFQTVVFTKDWHPQGHISFASSHTGRRPFEHICEGSKVVRTLWPDHCLQNTWGAELHPELMVCSGKDIIFEKASDIDKDSYSAFRNENGVETGLGRILKSRGIRQTYICGLAYDYCVGLTALDAAKSGFEVFLVENATMSISREGREQMRQKLRENNVHLITYISSERHFKDSI